MELLKHFEEEITGIVLLTLKDQEWSEFISKLPSEYRECYIPENELLSRIENFSSTKQKELAEILPSVGNIQSGDFGEILSYFITKERHIQHRADGPRKWRWKQEKNVAAPYSDVILFSLKEKGKPSSEDLLISVESKMKATANNSYHPIQNAIDGSQKDYVSRIATSLSWLRKKYKEESFKVTAQVEQLKEIVGMIERFIDSVNIGEYSKQLKAVAFVDKSFCANEISKSISIPPLNGTNIEIMVISVKDLKKAYESVFTEIPNL